MFRFIKARRASGGRGIPARSIFYLKFNVGAVAGAYFFFKFALYLLYSQIGFSLPLNLGFFALCLLGVRPAALRTAFRALLVVLALALLYHDSYMPTFSQVSTMVDDGPAGRVLYFLQTLAEMVDMRLLGTFAVVFVLSLFFSSTLHYSTLIVAGFAYIAAGSMQFSFTVAQEHQEEALNAVAASPDIPPQTGEANSATVESYVKTFLEFEKNRRTEFVEGLPEHFASFDVVVLNICSLATDDVEAAGLLNHKLFSRFDYSFDAFDSVSSYSTPSSMRLLRMNCGQETEAQMYSQRRSECELLNSLEQLGFQSQVFFDHNGKYGDYLKTLHDLAGLPERLYPLDKLNVTYRAFDGSPIYSDHDLFEAYAVEMGKSVASSVVTFMNILSLHDGNRKPSENRGMAYEPRLKTLLDDIDYFLTALEQGRRRTLLIMIPEHGAAIRGDKMQIAKLREIPTDKITRVPAMVRFVDPEKPAAPHTESVKGQYSYLALSELIHRAVENNVFSGDHALARPADIMIDLPQTAYVSEATNAWFMNFQGKNFFRFKTDDDWSLYVK